MSSLQKKIINNSPEAFCFVFGPRFVYSVINLCDSVVRRGGKMTLNLKFQGTKRATPMRMSR